MRLLLISLLFLVGCNQQFDTGATSLTPITAEQVVKGQTKDQIHSLFGEPQHVSQDGNIVVWTYQRNMRDTKGVMTMYQLTVFFGIGQSFTVLDKEFMQKQG